MGFANVLTIVMFAIIGAIIIIAIATVLRENIDTATLISEQQDEILVNTQSSIEITEVSLDDPNPTYWIDDIFDDFLEGNYSQVDIFTTPGSVAMQYNGTGYDEGSFESRIYDTGFTSNYTNIYWNDTLDAGTSIRFQIRTGDNETDLKTQTFTGPDGTATSYYLTSGTELNNTITNDKQFIQYKTYFTNVIDTNNAKLNWIKIGIQRASEHIVITVKNTGAQQLTIEDMDVFINDTRIPRQEQNRTIFIDEFEKPGLFSPGEIMNITAFFTLPTDEGTFTVIGTNKIKDTYIIQNEIQRNFCMIISFSGTNLVGTGNENMEAFSGTGNQQFYIHGKNLIVDQMSCMNNQAFTAGTVVCAIYKDSIAPYNSYAILAGGEVYMNSTPGYGGQNDNYVYNDSFTPITFDANTDAILVRCKSNGLLPAGTAETICNMRACEYEIV